MQISGPSESTVEKALFSACTFKVARRICRAVAFACANAIFFYAPDVIILDSEIHKHIAGLREMVVSSLIDYYAIGEKIIPEIACPNKSSSAFASLGIMCALRERFIYETTERFFEEKKSQGNGGNETSGKG